MTWGKGRWPYLVRTRHPKTVTAFTMTSEVGYRPADFVVGVLSKRHSPFGGFQFFVGGQFAEESTIDVIPNPTPELLRKLEARSRAWSRQNSAIEAKREELDNSFRTKRPHPVDQNHYIRKDRETAFRKFCFDNDKEDERLMAERTAEVSRLLERYGNKERTARAKKGQATGSKSISQSKQKAVSGEKRKTKSKSQTERNLGRRR